MTFNNGLAILILMSTATLFAGNHVAARLAFDDGTGLIIALLARSLMACLIMVSLAKFSKHSFQVPRGMRARQWLLGFLIAGQSFALYSAVARVPVAVALLLVNTWPVYYIVLGWITGKDPFRMPLALMMLLILSGLTLVLNLPQMFSDDLVLNDQWWTGVGFGLLSAILLCTAMWQTNVHLASMPGSVRSFYTMLIVFLSLLTLGLTGILPGSFALPESASGLWAIAALAMLYGIGSTVLFVLAPRLNMSRNSPVLNFEPVASLALGFIFLQQFLQPLQLIGGGLVVAGIVAIGLLR